MKRLTAFTMALAIISLNSLAGSTVDHLRCEYLVNPEGIHASSPRLSWVPASEERGQKQTAYRVLVATTREQLENNRGDLWDTGKVASDQSSQLAYAGSPLRSRMPCFWKVMVWDAAGKPSDWSTPGR